MPPRGGPHLERDWSCLRNRDWRPTEESGSKDISSHGPKDHAESERHTSVDPKAESSNQQSIAPAVTAIDAASWITPDPGASAMAGGRFHKALAEGNRGFATDSEIMRPKGITGSSGRDLKRFDFAAYDAPASPVSNAALEDLNVGKSRKLKGWDQFKVNEEKFGVVSTFKADLSQYTTVLDKSKITKAMRQQAERIAREMEKGGVCVQDEEYNDGEADEEDLFSAVQRGPGCATRSGLETTWTEKAAPVAGSAGVSGDAGAGKALLASLRATSGTARSVEGDHRGLVALKVQEWWRARRSAGAVVPQGADVAMVCPFSQRALGDVSQLVTHWAGALPRAVDLQGSTETPSVAASQHFGRLAQQLVWSEIAATSGLELVLPISDPRPGSVWESILTRVARDKGGGSSKDRQHRDAAACVVSEFIVEAVGLKCWRREQKIEHREVMEGIAAGLAIYALSNSPIGSATPWDAFAHGDVNATDTPSSDACEHSVGVCH
mmetsp:Transcript_73165/g.237948  ORF Transcript_73165/g.237948 Transcript_73165/m.237948 type:complete len:495 (+) Transcript_73165:112-1596(+)